MNKYTQHLKFSHGTPNRIGILLTNLGTPEQPTVSSIRRYLREFLSDQRVVEIPKPIWQIILNTLVLPLRPFKIKHNYETVWTEQGSPLLTYSQSLTEKLSKKIEGSHPHLKVAFGMRYGKPSIATALQSLYAENCQKIFILPMYPQYSATTTASTFDCIADFFRKERFIPEIQFINHYCDEPLYIQAIAQQIKDYLQSSTKPDCFVFSFHGLPRRNLDLGDPYYCHCQKTGRLIAEAAGLQEHEWLVTFQSRFGKAEWLQPYTDQSMKELAQDNKKHIAVLCPGFPIDCLETLEEIKIQNKDIFLAAGGQQFDYIPCLNDSDQHVDLLTQMLQQRSNDL